MARTEWHMSARELFVDTPEWEIEVLRAERTRRQREAAKQMKGQGG